MEFLDTNYAYLEKNAGDMFLDCSIDNLDQFNSVLPMCNFI